MMSKRSDIEARGAARRLWRRGRGGAFTLIELMAVISIIALISAMVLPTAARMFTASADEQARSMLAAMLSGNRAAAIENSCYTAVHVQIGRDEQCWAVAMTGELQTGELALFVAMEGAVPKRMPGGMAFGGVTDNYVLPGGGYDENALGDTGTQNLDSFTNFTVVFAPDGTVVTDIDSLPIKVEEDPKLFSTLSGETTAIWEKPRTFEYGVRAVTYFPYAELKVRNAQQRADYLNENGQFICLSYLTGRLMEAK